LSLSRSSLVFSGSPPGLLSLPVAALLRERERELIAAARCSFAGSSWLRMASSSEPIRARLVSRSSG
jgi:hypothetical protein